MYGSKWQCSLDVMSFAVTVFTDWHWVTSISGLWWKWTEGTVLPLFFTNKLSEWQC